MFHTVASGESLGSIARRYGVGGWEVIYDHPQNATFRQRRPDPNFIFPGDKIYVPISSGTSAPSGQARPTGALKPAGPKPTPQKKPHVGGSAPSGSSHVPATGHGGEKKGAGAADIVKDMGIEIPEKLVNFLFVLLDLDLKAENKELVAGFKKYMSVKKGLADLYDAAGLLEANDCRMGMVKVFSGTAKIWSAMPASWHHKATHALVRLFGRIPKIGALAKEIPILDEINALPPLLDLIAALLKGGADGAKEARGAAKDLVEALEEHPKVAFQVVGPLTEFFLDLIPAKMKAKLIAKAAGRKIPVVGTIVVGIADGVSIASDPTDWKRWAGLGSTIAGLFAGPGTVISALIDLSIIIGELTEHIREVSEHMAIHSSPVHVPK